MRRPHHASQQEDSIHRVVQRPRIMSHDAHKDASFAAFYGPNQWLICTFFLSKKAVALNEQVLKAKDARMKVTQEMLDVIRFIKINAI